MKERERERAREKKREMNNFAVDLDQALNELERLESEEAGLVICFVFYVIYSNLFILKDKKINK